MPLSSDAPQPPLWHRHLPWRRSWSGLTEGSNLRVSDTFLCVALCSSDVVPHRIDRGSLHFIEVALERGNGSRLRLNGSPVLMRFLKPLLGPWPDARYRQELVGQVQADAPWVSSLSGHFAKLPGNVRNRSFRTPSRSTVPPGMPRMWWWQLASAIAASVEATGRRLVDLAVRDAFRGNREKS